MRETHRAMGEYLVNAALGSSSNLSNEVVVHSAVSLYVKANFNDAIQVIYVTSTKL